MNVEPFQIGNYKFIKLVKTDRLVLKDQCRGAEMTYRFIFSYFALVELGKYTINYLQAVQSCTCSFSSMWIYCHPLIRQLDLFLVWYDQFLLLMVLISHLKPSSRPIFKIDYTTILSILTFLGQSGTRLNIPSSIFYVHKLQVIQNFFCLESELKILLISEHKQRGLGQFLLSH